MCLLSLTATCQVWTVALQAGLYTYNGFAGDGEQRPLVPRSGYWARLKRGVDMTSDVKSWWKICDVFMRFFTCAMGSEGARQADA
jgi:hypothetical protein